MRRIVWTLHSLDKLYYWISWTDNQRQQSWALVNVTLLNAIGPGDQHSYSLIMRDMWHVNSYDIIEWDKLSLKPGNEWQWCCPKLSVLSVSLNNCHYLNRDIHYWLTCFSSFPCTFSFACMPRLDSCCGDSFLANHVSCWWYVTQCWNDGNSDPAQAAAVWPYLT